MKDSQFPRIKVYDNKKSFDRFTAIFLDDPQNRSGFYGALAMSENPFHPQGFGRHCTAQDGRHLGKRIDSADLPEDCQKLIRQDLGK